MKLRTAVLFSIFFLAIPYLLYFINFCGVLSSDDQIWANFGSYIGGIVSSLFSYASFLIVLLVYYKSQEDIERKEIENKVFKYVELLNTCHKNIEVHFQNTHNYSEEVISNFNGIVGVINVDQKYINIAKSTRRTPQEEGEYNSISVRYLFYRDSIIQYIDLMELTYKFIVKNGGKNKNEFFGIFLSQLSEQQKMAFGYLKFELIEQYIEIKELFYKDNRIDGIINMGKLSKEIISYFGKSGK